ncbi:hypothetical protein L1887_09058 [Cichorium endivia]|nr:hypothetical protein L1887_09058 [Cichorium endivia]
MESEQRSWAGGNGPVDENGVSENSGPHGNGGDSFSGINRSPRNQLESMMERQQPGGNKEIPDLNYALSENSGDQQKIEKANYGTMKNKKLTSIRFKDRLKEKNLMKKKNKASDKFQLNREGVGVSSSSSSAASTSSEILKTVELGNEIGFQMEGLEGVVRSMVEGEGANEVYQ